MMVLAPADEAELAEALHTALGADGPVAIRYPRGAGRGVALPDEPQAWEAGRADVRRRGNDVALLAAGRMTQTCEAAADLLAEQGVAASVVNARWIKPLDLETVSWAASTHRLVVTVEENTAMGGFGGAVCEALVDLRADAPVLRLAVPDCFVTHGATAKLLSDIGLTADGIAAAVLGRLADVPDTPAPRRAQAQSKTHDATPDRRRAR
jgi:1-deoxy-D-xylulose-5-phosphate synthase